MEIRSVTLFAAPDLAPDSVAGFLDEARTAFTVPVQSTRLATTPFPDWWPATADTAGAAMAFRARWEPFNLDYISLGPVQLRHDPAWLDRLPGILGATDSLFASAAIADTGGLIGLDRAGRLADLVRKVSTIRADGLGNLYLTILANCPPGSPFFPVGYHDGGPTHFALALESADLAVRATANAPDLESARHRLVSTIETETAPLVATAHGLAERHDIIFSGIDFSLAPFPVAARSIGQGLEQLGISHMGGAGSLFAAAWLTEAIGRARFPRTGFCGLMLPVLEDAVLARRVVEGRLTLSDLLSYAAVCGVGLDTIPLPGDVPVATLAGVLLDIAALAVRIDKPLTARLMPMPGMAAGDALRFDFPYFANSGVMPVSGRVSAGLFQAPAPVMLRPLRPAQPDA